MKRLALIAAMLAGCEDGVELTPDAAIDAAEAPTCLGLSSEQSFAAPIGGCCVESAAPLCATGDGACVAGRCEQQCSGRWPACPDGSKGVMHARANGDTVCTCPSD